jgi:hypothetical protein
MEAMKKQKKYNLNKLITYNRVLNFVMGDKTGECASSVKEYAIKKFIKSGEQFIYLKRHKTDLKDVNNFFDELHLKYSKHKLRVKGWEFWIDDQLAGWAIPLSAWQSEKSNEYPNVNTIIFDDFLNPEPYFGKYLKQESKSLLNLMDTVIRTRDNVKCFCIGHSNEIVNPYFLYFGLIPNTYKQFNLNKDIAIEFMEPNELYSIKDGETFISDKPMKPIFLFSVRHKGELFGCWYDGVMKMIFLSHLYIPKSNKILDVLAIEKSKERVYLEDFGEEFTIKKVFELFKQGNASFHNTYVRNVFFDIFKSQIR